jgi:uncharacterized membrane protein (DUF485 family)
LRAEKPPCSAAGAGWPGSFAADPGAETVEGATAASTSAIDRLRDAAGRLAARKRSLLQRIEAPSRSMATTPVFAEILVLGLEVEAWLVLLLLAAFGTGWVDVGDVKDFASLVTVVVLALAYVLGIIVDRLADTLLDRLEKTKRGKRIKQRMSKNRNLEKPEKVAIMRMTVMHESEGLTRFLDYQRSRWRVARATVLNIAIAGPVGALYVAVGTHERWLWALAPAAFALVLSPVTYFGAVRIQDAWVGRLVDAYRIVTAPSDK